MNKYFPQQNNVLTCLFEYGEHVINDNEYHDLGVCGTCSGYYLLCLGNY